LEIAKGRQSFFIFQVCEFIIMKLSLMASCTCAGNQSAIAVPPIRQWPHNGFTITTWVRIERLPGRTREGYQPVLYTFKTAQNQASDVVDSLYRIAHFGYYEGLHGVSSRKYACTANFRELWCHFSA
jgi:hypothetical protein